MVKAIVLIGFAIPGIIATLFAVSLVTQPDIPFSAANPRDTIAVEYTKHRIATENDGGQERIVITGTEILEIQNDGSARYYSVEDGSTPPSIHGKLDEDRMQRIKAVFKETGFVALPVESFPAREGVSEYQKSSVKVELNGATAEVRWQDEDATEGPIPPIIALVESELDCVMGDILISPAVTGDASHCSVPSPLSAVPDPGAPDREDILDLDA